MTFNIEWGGVNVSFENVVEAIRRSKADIVGIQEAEGNLVRLAAELGWYYDLRNYTVARFPLLDPPGADGKFVYIEVSPGKGVAMANVHLPSEYSGPDAVRDGTALGEILATERRVRLSKLAPHLEQLAPLIKRNMPLFVTGDFNAPAHTDWTEAAIGTRPFLQYAVVWPVSMAMAKAGFHDAWREVHPDPVSNPGLTWWAGRPPLELYSPGENDPQDRIDFIWYSGPVSIKAVALAGERGGPEVSISVDPWPSDHRAVVAEFTVTPSALPALMTTQQRVYLAGQDIQLRYRLPAGPASGTLLKVVAGDGTLIVEQRAGSDETVELPASLFAPGQYLARMEDENGRSIMEREFWVLAEDATPGVAVSPGPYQPGQAIGIEWHNAPGNRNDYVAVYHAGTAAGYGNELAWTYIKSLPHGQLSLDESNAESVWPLEAGRYRIRLMKDDGYDPLAESSMFEVK